MYRDSQVRDLTSVDEITGRPVLVNVHDVADRRLSEFMKMVDERIKSQRRSLHESNNASTSTTTEPSVSGESIETPKGQCIVVLPVSKRMADYLRAHAKLDEPVKAAEDLSAPLLHIT